MKFFFICEFFIMFKGTFLFDCIHKRNSLICVNKELLSFPKSNLINKDIDNLDLSKNNIRILYEDALEYFDNLINLTLDSNKIWKITNNAFKNQKKLQSLSLRNNALIISTNTFLSNVFRHLSNLHYLDLSNNPLGIIPGEFFVELRNLRSLYLEEMVKEIRILKGALSKLYNLKTLSLAKNNFKSLPNYMLIEFQEMQLESLLLHENPWACDCRMRWFKMWLITIRQNNENSYLSIEDSLKNIHPMICKIPQILNGKLFLDLSLNKFECKPKSLLSGKLLIANNLDNITLSCLFESDPKSYVKWFKNGILIQNHWERIKKTQSVGIKFVANLTIINIKYGSDDGSYVCETTNNKGFARTNFTLIIKSPSIYQDNLVEYKNQQTILLLIIVATGIITLIILVGIVIYCFYGNYSNNEVKCVNSKISDLLYANDNMVIARNSEFIPVSQYSKSIYQMKEPNDLIKWSVNETDLPGSVDKKNGDFETQEENNENPIVKNHMLNDRNFSNPNSDSDNQSCQLSIHEDCPIHGIGNSYNCPVHGLSNEVKELEDSSYNWSYVFNNKNTIKNNYYSLKSAPNTKTPYETRFSSIHSYPMKLKQSDIENSNCLISSENISSQHLQSNNHK